MPQAATMTIADGQGVPVNQTFTLYAPASGYGGIAEWRLKAGANASVFPAITYSADRDNQRKANRGKGKLRLPQAYVDSTTGLTKAGSAFEFNFTCVVPDDFPESKKADAAAFVKNWLATTLFQEVLKDGTPTT